MRKILLGVFCLIVVSGLTAQETELCFESPSAIDIYLVTDLIAEPATAAVTSDLSAYYKKLVFLTKAPSTVVVTGSQVVLNIGGLNEYNRTIGLTLTGQPQTIKVAGSAWWTSFFTMSAGVSLGASLVLGVSMNNQRNTDSIGALGLLTALTATTGLGSLVGWALNLPSITVSQTAVGHTQSPPPPTH